MVRLPRHPRLLVGLILLLCGAGAFVGGALVLEYESGGQAGTIVSQLCQATGVPRRACVGHASGFGTIDRTGSAIAFLGLAYFVAIGTWFVFVGGPRKFGRPWHLVPLRLAYLGFAASIVLLGLMAVRVTPGCVVCAIMHALNLVLVPTVRRLNGARPSADALLVNPAAIEPRRVARLTVTNREARTTMALALAIVGGLWLYRHDQRVRRSDTHRFQSSRVLLDALQNDAGFLVREYGSRAWFDMPLRPAERRGPGRPELIVFTDWTPHSARELSHLETIVAAFDGAVDVRVRHVPRGEGCAPGTDPNHVESHRAACAAEAAHRLGEASSAKRMVELLVSHAGRLHESIYPDLAGEAGYDAEAFVAEMHSPAVRDAVCGDVALAGSMGVRTMPVLLLNGRIVPPICDTPVFWNAMADAHGHGAQLLAEVNAQE